MGWEMRRSRGKFYYRSYRRKGRVRKKYVGSASDNATQIIALADRLQRAERKAAAAASRAERAAYEEANALVVAWCAESDLLTTAGLACAGFYRKQRGPWKMKKRRSRMVHSEQSQVPLVAPTQDEVRALVLRAEAGDVESRAQLEQVLDLHPAIWQQVADLAGQAEAALIRLISSKSTLLTRSLDRLPEGGRSAACAGPGLPGAGRLVVPGRDLLPSATSAGGRGARQYGMGHRLATLWWGPASPSVRLERRPPVHYVSRSPLTGVIYTPSTPREMGCGQ